MEHTLWMNMRLCVHTVCVCALLCWLIMCWSLVASLLSGTTHTHTHTGVAGCWGVGSGALGGSRGLSQWVSVSCQQQFVLREQYGEREMSSLIHQPAAASAPLGPVCPHSKTTLSIPACAGCDLLTGTQCVEVVGPVSSTWMPLPRASISTIIFSACGKHC